MSHLLLQTLASAQSVDPTETGSGAEWWIATGVGALLLAGLVTFAYTTRAGIIARATTKEAIRQPVFSLLLAIATLILLLNTWLPFFSFGDDVKMLKDCGLATILISGLLLAVWTASTSIADEIEGKTAMTLLSKPINRPQFVLGKYVGILQAVLLLLIPLTIVFLMLIFYKVGYDAREAGREVPGMWNPDENWFEESRIGAITTILPGLVLIFLEAAVLAAVSVAISTRVPMIVNIVSCFSIFVVGHLTDVLVQRQILQLEFVSFMARLIATVLPSIWAFKIDAAVATDLMVPASYLGYSALYAAVYSTAAILLAFILFEDRDLA